ncbi:MAG: hypothetical protein ACRDJP_00495 [Actinomycetota bacterium]
MRRWRRDEHPSREAFERVLTTVERAKRELLAAMPSPRGIPGRPLADALVDFESELHQAAAAMPAWRAPETEDVWRECLEAIHAALVAAERLRVEAPALDYEGLVAVLADLMAPLEAFEEADRALRSH